MTGPLSIALAALCLLPARSRPSTCAGRSAPPGTGRWPRARSAPAPVEEAIYDSLLRAETVTGHEGRTVEAIPVERVRELMERYGRVAER